MPNNARIGAGTELRLGDSAEPTVYTKVANVSSLGEIGQTAPETDATPIDATSREYVGGLRDGNTLGIVLNYEALNSHHKELRDSIGKTVPLQVVFADGEEVKFSYVVTSYARGEITAEGLMQANVEGRISGGLDWTDAPAS